MAASTKSVKGNNLPGETPNIKADRELVLTRVFNAPRALVFAAWTQVEHLRHWWGPEGFTNPVCELEARVGGSLRIVMRAPNGAEYPMTGTVVELAEPEIFAFDFSVPNELGESIFEGRNTITFADEVGKTRVTVEAKITRTTPDAGQYLAGMEIGWNQSLDRLAAFVQTM